MDIVRGSAKNRYRRSRSSASPDPACLISRTATPSLAPAVHSPFCSARNTPRYNYQLRRYLSAAISVSGTVSTHSTRLRLLSAPTLFPRSSTYRCSAVARMAFRWIVNAGLIAIPIGSTLGVLFGIDASRHASGQAPLFSGGDGNNGNGSSGGTGGNGGSGGNNTPPDSTGGGDGGDHSNHTELGITVSTYCSLTYGILPPAAGGLNYSLNPNQWGVLALDGPNAPSGLCMNVTTFNNQTYATNTSAPEWSVTWKYTPGPETQPVHAYPNIQVLDGLPLTLSDVKAVNFDMAWTYNLGNETKPTSDTPEFDSISLNTNVAIDMFFDSNKTNAIDSTLAAYEIMVWFAHYGNAAQTIGNASGIVETKVINQTTFDLYYGSHVVGGKDQNVFTWVASENVESFTGDISPLITELTSKSGTQYPKESDYMGSFGFGSEAYNADQWVTFNVPHLQVDIQT